MAEHSTHCPGASVAEPGVREHLELSRIRLDGGTQPRAEINEVTVTEYAEGMQEDASFPPVVVFFDGAAHWLADGFHRYHGTKKAGYPTILSEVRNGTQRDAMFYGLSANACHGLRETRADRRRKIEIMLRDAEWVQWSDREIARQCGVDHKTVAAVRTELVGCGEIPQIDIRAFERNGTVFTQSARIEPAASDDGAPVEQDEVRQPDTCADNIDDQPLDALVSAVATLCTAQDSVVQQADQTESDEPPGAPPEPGELERLRAEVADLRAEVANGRAEKAELAKNLEEALADNETMAGVFEADDPLAAAITELKRKCDQNKVLNVLLERRTNERNDALRSAQRWESKFEAATKRREEG